MLLKQLRKRLLAASQRAGSSFDDEELDFALQTMLRDMELTDSYSYEDTTATAVSANDPEFSLTTLNATWDDQFRPEKVHRCEISYTDNGAWATSTSYLKGIDLVSNDSKFWVATSDHTSSSANAPTADDSVWKRVLTKRGPRIDLVDYNTIARALGDGIGIPQQGGFVLADNDATISPSQPTMLGFQSEDKAYVWPVPDVAYKVTFTIKSEVAIWTAGTEANVDISVPEKILLPAIATGGIYYLDRDRNDSQHLKRDFQALKNEIKGALFVNRGVGHKDESAYADGNDPSRYRGSFTRGYRNCR
jgi:hypothetical protein